MKKNYCYLMIFVIATSFQSKIYSQNLKNYDTTLNKRMVFNKGTTLKDAISEFSKFAGIGDENTFEEIQSNNVQNGASHIKFQQYYKGIKVEYGTLIVHLREGQAFSANGELYSVKDLALQPVVSSSKAFLHAVQKINANSYIWNTPSFTGARNPQPEGDLIFFPLIKGGSAELRLAYKFDIYATAPLSRNFVYIDAQTGQHLYSEPIIKHLDVHEKINISTPKNKKLSSKSRALITGSADTRYSGNRNIETKLEVNGTYTLNDNIRNVHTYNAQNSPTNGTYEFTKVNFADDDNNWTASEYDNAARDNAALDAHWGAMNVYDFYAMLGRDSFDDQGSEIRNYVHVGPPDYFNAFWNGSVMSYGDGNPDPLTSIDIIAHEITHAVTTYTANLVYARESGAMNEGFSDIFGAAIEYFAKGTGSDTNPNPETWLLAEDFWPSGFLRSMSNPKSKGDPDTYNGSNYTDATENCSPIRSNDYCGVHSNSGVLNHWFYILVTGDSGSNDAGDNYDVTGIGMTKAQEIAYFILRDYLTPNSTFMDARDAGVEIASELYGNNSLERKSVQDAFYAVNIGEAFIPYDKDISLIEFEKLVDITCGEGIIPAIKVRNSGILNEINEITINVTIDGILENSFKWSGTLDVNEEINIELPTINKSTVKSYNLTVEVIVDGDGDSTNNSIKGTFRVNRSDESPTEVNTFENFLDDYWLTYNEDGADNLWVIGDPNKDQLNEVGSGTNAYVTNTVSNYPNETKAYLISPCYDFTSLDNPVIKFMMQFELENNNDILYVEYSVDKVNWEILGSADDPNWYNSDRIFESPEISTDCLNCPGAQWTGSNSKLTLYSQDVSFLVGEPNINFRFVFHSNAVNTDEGVIIDDFFIQTGTLGINDKENLGSINIFPNPSKNIFHLHYKNSSKLDIQIFDTTGKSILNEKNIDISSNTYSINMTDYSTGLYFAKINIDGVIVVKKLILN